MKRLVAICAFVFWADFCAGAEVNLAIVRWRPNDKKEVLAPARANISAADLKAKKSQAMIAALRQRGEAELLYQSAESFTDGKPKHIEKSELATVVLPGETTALPPITRLAINFDLAWSAAQSTLAWNGFVKWSPQLVDRAALTLLTRAQTNLTIIRPFAPSGQTAAFEYPILKETTFQSSKITKPGELIITSTAAEAGGTPPEVLLLCLWIEN
jgi:hypothetical protein